MSEASDDWATIKASQRALTVACVMRYLGPQRERDAEALADCMMRHLDDIRGAAGGLLMPSAPHPDAARLVQELGEQMRTHSEELVETSFRALAMLLQQVLSVAVRRDR